MRDWERWMENAFVCICMCERERRTHIHSYVRFQYKWQRLTSSGSRCDAQKKGKMAITLNKIVKTTHIRRGARAHTDQEIQEKKGNNLISLKSEYAGSISIVAIIFRQHFKATELGSTTKLTDSNTSFSSSIHIDVHDADWPSLFSIFSVMFEADLNR